MKKISIIFLSFVIFIAPPFAYAGVGKYIIDTVKATPNAVKVSATNTATGAKHVINHGVSSNAMAGAIGGGLVSMAVGGGVSLAFEVITGLALDAVDWMMDAENNQLKWKEKTEGGGGGSYGYKAGNGAGGSTPAQAASAGLVKTGLTGDGVTCYTQNNFTYSCRNNLGQLIVVTKDVSPPEELPWKKIPLPTLAQKTIDLANDGDAQAQKTVEDYVKKIAERGDLDAELDASTDITKSDKECSAGYEKVGSICVKKAQDEKICPADTIKVGDKCIKKPKEEEDDQNCGGCCDEMLSALGAIADMNAQFYDNSLDNDATMLSALNAINDNFANMSSDFNDLLDAANLTNDKLSEISTKLADFNVALDALKKSIDDGNADILAKLADVDASIQDTNALLDKVNDNLEKMQKCEETEFNKKICDWIDWTQQPHSPADDGKLDIIDKSDELLIDNDRINFANQCPAPTPINTSVGGFPVSTELDYQPLCDFFIMLNPFVIGMGGISSALIIAGGARRG